MTIYVQYQWQWRVLKRNAAKSWAQQIPNQRSIKPRLLQVIYESLVGINSNLPYTLYIHLSTALRTKWNLDLWQSSLCTGDWRKPPSSTEINIALRDCYFQYVIFSSFYYFLLFKSNYFVRHYVLIPTQPLWLGSLGFRYVVVS
jgi:hypothetical protein